MRAAAPVLLRCAILKELVPCDGVFIRYRHRKGLHGPLVQGVVKNLLWEVGDLFAALLS